MVRHSRRIPNYARKISRYPRYIMYRSHVTFTFAVRAHHTAGEPRLPAPHDIVRVPGRPERAGARDQDHRGRLRQARSLDPSVQHHGGYLEFGLGGRFSLETYISRRSERRKKKQHRAVDNIEPPTFSMLFAVVRAVEVRGKFPGKRYRKREVLIYSRGEGLTFSRLSDTF